MKINKKVNMKIESHIMAKMNTFKSKRSKYKIYMYMYIYIYIYVFYTR